MGGGAGVPSSSNVRVHARWQIAQHRAPWSAQRGRKPWPWHGVPLERPCGEMPHSHHMNPMPVSSWMSAIASLTASATAHRFAVESKLLFEKRPKTSASVISTSGSSSTPERSRRAPPQNGTSGAGGGRWAFWGGCSAIKVDRDAKEEGCAEAVREGRSAICCVSLLSPLGSRLSEGSRFIAVMGHATGSTTSALAVELGGWPRCRPARPPSVAFMAEVDAVVAPVSPVVAPII
mmetsp:Transcript_36063/g.95026  ORF Transcript_36063/g.95026 Transcript_36063/m.95026 type:complete len:234 (-) Transcript_36063:1359-2060(-)